MNTKIQRILLVSIAALLAAPSFAKTAAKADTTQTETGKKEEKTIYFAGRIKDKFTKGAVPGVFVTLMKADSTVVDTMHVREYKSYSFGFGGSEETAYYFNIKPENANYIMKFEHPDYETLTLAHSVTGVNKRTQWVEGPDALMRRIKRQQTDSIEGGQLNEVVVKATKVKMVWKGDTLVFNADAFNVPEGSMLDGLIKQLPGVELKDNGEIFVNGRKIDNLTLNGADFFKGKNKIMLENLPYFTVKNVQVYEKQTEENKFLGIDDPDKKEYTMDVVLKKEYSVGGSANVEAGMGTDGRYKAKAFGMRFTDHTRAVLFGGLNNVNETTEYDSEGKEKERRNSSGDRHFRQIGGMFAYKSKEEKFSNSLDLNTTWSNDHTVSRSSGETFLTTGSTFYRSQSENRSKPMALNLTDRMDWRISKKLNSYLYLRMDYRHAENEGQNSSLTTNDLQQTDSVNFTSGRSWSRGNTLNGSASANLYGVTNNAGDFLYIGLGASGSKTYSPESFTQSHYYYHKTGTADKRNQYSYSLPESYSLSARLQYTYRLSKAVRLEPHYDIAPSYSTSDELQYRLDKLDETWAPDGTHAFRSLPSTRDSLQMALDADNSRSQTTRNLEHEAGLDIRISGETKNKGYYYFSLGMPLRFDHNRIDYRSEALTTSLSRHYTLFAPRIYFFTGTSGKNRKKINANFDIYSSKPSAFQLIDRPVTSDPLNLTVGNPNLRQQITHRYWIEASVNCDSIDRNIKLTIDGNSTHNAFANGYTYDPETGVRTYRAENIASGNWYFSTRLNYTRALDKKKYFHLDNEMRYRMDKSTDLANVSGSTSSELSVVKTHALYIKPSVRYQRGDITLRLRFRGEWRHYNRSITTDMPLPDNIWDLQWGFSGTYKMPYNVTLDTDLELNRHYGYSDPEMNDTRLYWDASLTKSFKAGRWLLKLRGYDLLGQLTNLRYNVNAQGRTETWTNSMRRYALLTVAYKFTQKKK